MNAAHLRVGSLEILAAMTVFGFAVSRFGRNASAPIASRKMRAVLLVTEPLARGGEREVSLELHEGGEPAVIGRASDAAVGLLDPEVSRAHAQIELVKGVVYLADLGSTNGTFLNGKKVAGDGIELREGDYLDVGTTRISIGAIAP